MSKKKPITTGIKTASYASLLRESDKGCLLLVVGVFDKVLQNIVELAITSNLHPASAKQFLRESLFGENGTLHSFSSKVNIAYAFRLISEAEFNAMHILRKLRNEAAHCYFDFTFADSGIVAQLNKLPSYDLELYRQMFIKESGVQAAEAKGLKFDFVVRCYAVLKELEGVLLKEIERYAIEVRGMDLTKAVVHTPAAGSPEVLHQ
jgi:DNA-binding MltR family transcriptional regulator